MTGDSKPSRFHKFAVALALFVLLAYVLPLGLTYAFQRQLLYQPDTAPVGDPATFGLPDMKVIAVKTEDGLELKDWFRPPKNGDKYTMVIFHGSYVTLGHVATVARMLKGDHGLFLCEYRGFGGSPGTPTEQGIYADARAAVKWLVDNGYPADHLIFYGASMGTGVAVQMALETRPAMLILHSPYASITAIAKEYYPFFPVDWLLKDRFDSVGKIGKVHAPLLILHGMEDDMIPIASARQLFAAANDPKEFMAVAHFQHINFLFSPGIFKAINAWIDKQIAAAH